jgi:Zn-dependent alcohol dehydrogenase
VGLQGVPAAKQLGVGRIVAMSRHGPRQQMAREFGATDGAADGDRRSADTRRFCSGCVEVRCFADGRREVRDSKDRQGPILAFSPFE